MSEEAKSKQEPSMEEILASIRRIISEDDIDDAKSNDTAVEEGVEEENDDVLELTDVVEDEEPVQETEPAEEEAPQSQDDIDSLFDEADLSDTDDEIELVEEEEEEPQPRSLQRSHLCL